MNHLDALIDEYTKGILDAIETLNDVQKEKVLNWQRREYSNHMLISREAYIETLDVIIAGDFIGKKLFRFLRDNIEDYGAPKVFWIVAHNLTNNDT